MFLKTDIIIIFSKKKNYDGTLWILVFATNSNFVISKSLQHFIFQTWIILSNRIHSLKYLRSTPLNC